jgi:small GTP-binding protein
MDTARVSPYGGLPDHGSTTSSGMRDSTLHRLLNAEQDRILRQERTLLETLRVSLARLDATDEDLALLKHSLHQLEELFLLVVVGEFNAGKSAVINALLGDRFLPEGVVPTTSQIYVLRYGDGDGQLSAEEEVQIIHLPVEWLREINLVDTPGTNAVIQHHQQLTEHFVPRSDLVLFVTSVDRPFSESERTFLEQIQRWGKKIVLVVNKLDLLESEEETDQILEYVRANARQLLGIEPRVFPVSARLALRAKKEIQTQAQRNGEALRRSQDWQRSQFEPLEQFILSSLDSQERVRLKLDNPLGVAANLIARYRAAVDERRTLLQGDFQTLDTIEEQLEAYQRDMVRDFKYQRSRVDNVLYQMAERGDKFFDETLRISRLPELLNSERLRGEFERAVVGDTSRQIEIHVNELIDWLVDRDYRQWQAVMEFINRRASQHADRLVGQVNSDFEFNRQNLLASIGRGAREVVDSYDREAEALKLAQEVQRALVQTAAVEAGALGLGALLVALLQTTLLDVTGLLGASAVAVLGLYVLPYRRSQIKRELRERIKSLRERLDTAINRQFDAELVQSLQRIRQAIAPYTRFVRVEREKLESLDAELKAAQEQLRQLRSGVQELA